MEPKLPIMKMRMIYLAVLASLVSSSIALAHHSGVMFDAEKEVTLKGTIKEFTFENPHVSIIISVPNEKGGSMDWNFEAASVRGMAQAGWRRSTVKFGDSITLVGPPLKDGRPGAQLVRAILADGTVLKSNLGGNY